MSATLLSPGQRWLALLAGLLFLLCLVIFLLEAADDRHTAARQLLPTEQITTISINGAAGEIVLQRDEQQWNMLMPLQAAANPDRVAALLSLLVLPEREAYDMDEINLAELGLKNPQLTIKLNDLKFAMGNLSVQGDARYVLVQQRIHLFNEIVYPLVNAGPSALLLTPQE